MPLVPFAVIGAAFAFVLLGALAARRSRENRLLRRGLDEARARLDEVRAREEWYSLVLGSMEEEVYFTTPDRRYTYANHAVRREFGYDAGGAEIEKVLEQLEVLRVDGTPRPLEEAPPLRALRGEVVRDEPQLVRNPRTGELRHRVVSATPVRGEDGAIIGAVSVVRDVTEQQRVERALREADRRKDAFLASLSHELRNPLAPIRTAARVLESPEVAPDEVRRAAAIVSRQVARMGTLLDDLLDVSRFTTGERALQRRRVSLQQVLDHAVEVARPLVQERGHRLLSEPSSPVPTIDVDELRITQAIANLLTNAAKYTEPGGELTLGWRLDADALVVFVRDTGIGIMPEMKDRIFEMFVQADPARVGSQGGLGVGLALVKGIVEAHGGRVEVASAGSGQGSTFTVTLPRDVIDCAPAPRPGTRGAHGTVDAVRRTVLVADDNRDGAESLGLLLRAAGHEVHVAHDGLQALELAERVRPDVALLDIGMPGLDGYEVASRIRREPWGAGIRLVAMTGWGQESDKAAARAAGFDLHLTKPADPDQLIAALG